MTSDKTNKPVESIKKEREDWMNFCEENYQEEIQYSIKNSIIYERNEILSAKQINFIPFNLDFDDSILESNDMYREPNIKVIMNKTENYITSKKFAELISTTGEIPMVVNFASYFRPGGGYINGIGRGQEESLCDKSILANVLKSLDIYNKRKEHERGLKLYSDSCIYTPNILFDNKNPNDRSIVKTDVLSISAVNCNRLPKENLPISKEVMKSRIRRIFNVAFLNDKRNIILGAFGCGIFKNDPRDIAKIFMETIEYYGYLFDNILFVIPDKEYVDIFNKQKKAILDLNPDE